MATRRAAGEGVGLAREAGGAGPRIGRVVGLSRGRLRVDCGAGPVEARVSAALDDAALERAAADRQEALVLFAEGDAARPVVVALLRSASPLTDAVLAAALPEGEKVARVDGRRVEIEGREEVVLRCGKASLTLRRDGKVVLRGVDVVSQADQVHKVRGGKVQIN